MMLLKDLLSLKRSIEEDRKSMSHLVKKKGIQDPEVLKFSQELDKKIVNLQRVLLDMQASNFVSQGLTTKMTVYEATL